MKQIYLPHDATLNAADGEVLFSAGPAAPLASAKLDARQIKTVANANAVAGVPVLYRIDIADGTTADIDVTLTYKTRVTDAWLIKTGGAGGASDTIQVKNVGNAISNAMSINVADQTVVRAGTIDDAQHEIAAGGTLRITRTKASAANVACTVYVPGVLVA